MGDFPIDGGRVLNSSFWVKHMVRTDRQGNETEAEKE